MKEEKPRICNNCQENYPTMCDANPLKDDEKGPCCLCTYHKPHTRLSLGLVFSQNRIMKIVFEKRNGSKRTMICSLHPDLLPIPTVEDSRKTSSREPQENLFSVFDIQAGCWKRFTIDKVISVSAYVSENDTERTDPTDSLLEG